MNYQSWNDDIPGETSPDTDAILAKHISDALRKEESWKNVQKSGKSDVPEWVSIKQQKRSSPTESSVLLSVDGDLLREDFEQRLKRVAELQEAAAVGFHRAVLELQKIALRDSAGDVRVAAVEALGALGEHTLAMPLLLSLRDPFWDVRAAAVQALGKLGNRAPIKHLIAHLKQEPDISVREAIIRVLGQQGRATPTNVIVDILLKDESWLVREAAAWALGQLEERAPLPALIYALGFDRSEQVRAAAATSLGQTGSQGAMASLFEALEDDDSDVREAVGLALQQLDEEKESQVPPSDYKNIDLAFLEDWFSSDRLLSELPQKRREWQAFSKLTEYIKDKRGGVKTELTETDHGLVILFHCFYEHPEKSLQETLLPSIQGISKVEPIEAALRSRDNIIQAAVKGAFEIRERREWLDLLVVSFVVSCAKLETRYPPFRVVVCSMSCRRVREHDVSVLDQLSDQWRDIVDEQLICEEIHDLADLQVWYQPVA